MLLTDHPWAGVEIEQEVLSSAGVKLIEAPDGADEQVLLDLAEDVSAIMTCWAPVDRVLIERSPRLGVVARMGVGLDNIDLRAAADHGVVVTNVPDYCVEEVSDHAVALVHAWARGIVIYDRDVRVGNWSPNRFPLRRVSDLTVGVLGLGRIGRRTAMKFVSLGCRVLGFDVQVQDPPGDVEIVTHDRLLSESDVVTLHVPLLGQTRHLVDAAFLGTMKPGSLLVNVSRGPLVDSAALVDALKEGRLGAAALDVLETEPKVPDELRELPNTIITPHVAFSSDLSVIELRRRASEDVVAVLEGRQPRNPVSTAASSS